MRSENRAKCSLCECIILQVIFLNKYKHKSCTRAGVKRVAHGGSVICRERYWFDYRRKTASLEVLKDVLHHCHCSTSLLYKLPTKDM